MVGFGVFGVHKKGQMIMHYCMVWPGIGRFIYLHLKCKEVKTTKNCKKWVCVLMQGMIN